MATTTQARKTTQSTKKTARQSAGTVHRAERTVRSLVTDGAYAAVGLGDTAIGALRSIPGRVDRLRKQAPKTLESRVKGLWTETPEELKARAGSLRVDAGKELDSYATRGRAVVASVSSAKASQRALEQTRVARTQVKAAATSVRKALGQSVEAVESAADKVGDERPVS